MVLDVPGPGNNKAFGNWWLGLAIGVGLTTITGGGTGKFTWFHASLDGISTHQDWITWSWDGTYPELFPVRAGS